MWKALHEEHMVDTSAAVAANPCNPDSINELENTECSEDKGGSTVNAVLPAVMHEGLKESGMDTLNQRIDLPNDAAAIKGIKMTNLNDVEGEVFSGSTDINGEAEPIGLCEAVEQDEGVAKTQNLESHEEQRPAYEAAFGSQFVQTQYENEFPWIPSGTSNMTNIIDGNVTDMHNVNNPVEHNASYAIVPYVGGTELSRSTQKYESTKWSNYRKTINASDSVYTSDERANNSHSYNKINKVQTQHDYFYYPGREESYVGLSNQGATCYMNSLLQALFMTPNFRKSLFEWRYDEENDPWKEDCIPYQLQVLFGTLQLADVSYADTKNLTKSFQWDASDSFQQHDIEEFNKMLSDAIEKSCCTQENQFINEQFFGEAVDFVLCKGCTRLSERKQPFADLKLTVRDEFQGVANESLVKALDNYLYVETLEGSNQYACDNCGVKCDAFKGTRISKLPPTLTIQIKRFVFDYISMMRIKLNNKLSFPSVLDMNRFTSTCTEASDFIGRISNGCEDTCDAMSVENSCKDGKLPSATSKSGSVFGNETEIELDVKNMCSYRCTTEKENFKLLDDQNLLDSCSLEENRSFNYTKGDLLNDTVNELLDVNDAPKHVEEEEDAADEAEETFLNEESIRKQIIKCSANGPLVYELYAILVHSGSALGGHYFAYIKNLTTRRWYRFNDSVVMDIQPGDITKTFGDDTLLRYSSANAYLLMYNQVQMADGIPQQVKYPVNEDVPAYIVEAVKEAQRKEKEETERLRQKELELNVTIIRRLPKYKAAPYAKLIGGTVESRTNSSVSATDCMYGGGSDRSSEKHGSGKNVDMLVAEYLNANADVGDAETYALTLIDLDIPMKKDDTCAALHEAVYNAFHLADEGVKRNNFRLRYCRDSTCMERIPEIPIVMDAGDDAITNTVDRSTPSNVEERDALIPSGDEATPSLIYEANSPSGTSPPSHVEQPIYKVQKATVKLLLEEIRSLHMSKTSGFNTEKPPPLEDINNADEQNSEEANETNDKTEDPHMQYISVFNDEHIKQVWAEGIETFIETDLPFYYLEEEELNYLLKLSMQENVTEGVEMVVEGETNTSKRRQSKKVSEHSAELSNDTKDMEAVTHISTHTTNGLPEKFIDNIANKQWDSEKIGQSEISELDSLISSTGAVEGGDYDVDYIGGSFETLSSSGDIPNTMGSAVTSDRNGPDIPERVEKRLRCFQNQRSVDKSAALPHGIVPLYIKLDTKKPLEEFIDEYLAVLFLEIREDNTEWPLYGKGFEEVYVQKWDNTLKTPKEVYIYPISRSDTYGDLKVRIFLDMGIPGESQLLLFKPQNEEIPTPVTETELILAYRSPYWINTEAPFENAKHCLIVEDKRDTQSNALSKGVRKSKKGFSAAVHYYREKLRYFTIMYSRQICFLRYELFPLTTSIEVDGNMTWGELRNQIAADLSIHYVDRLYWNFLNENYHDNYQWLESELLESMLDDSIRGAKTAGLVGKTDHIIRLRLCFGRLCPSEMHKRFEVRCYFPPFYLPIRFKNEEPDKTPRLLQDDAFTKNHVDEPLAALPEPPVTQHPAKYPSANDIETLGSTQENAQFLSDYVARGMVKRSSAISLNSQIALVDGSSSDVEYVCKYLESKKTRTQDMEFSRRYGCGYVEGEYASIGIVLKLNTHISVEELKETILETYRSIEKWQHLDESLISDETAAEEEVDFDRSLVTKSNQDNEGPTPVQISDILNRVNSNFSSWIEVDANDVIIHGEPKIGYFENAGGPLGYTYWNNESVFVSHHGIYSSSLPAGRSFCLNVLKDPLNHVTRATKPLLAFVRFWRPSTWQLSTVKLLLLNESYFTSEDKIYTMENYMAQQFEVEGPFLSYLCASTFPNYATLDQLSWNSLEHLLLNLRTFESEAVKKGLNSVAFILLRSMEEPRKLQHEAEYFAAIHKTLRVLENRRSDALEQNMAASRKTIGGRHSADSSREKGLKIEIKPKRYREQICHSSPDVSGGESPDVSGSTTPTCN